VAVPSAPVVLFFSLTSSPDNDVSADSPTSANSSGLSRRQQSLERPAQVTGFGYWSGEDVTLEFRPAATNTGIVFVRQDLTNFHRIPVDVFNRVEVPRRTNLARYGVAVEMVEHVVAALVGLHVDNCEVWTSASELPGCDGSSQPFVDALLEAGIIQQDAWCQPLVLQETTRVGDEDSWVMAEPLAEQDTPGSLILHYELDYGPQAAIGCQSLEIVVQPESFLEELAAARTFILESEAEWLQRQGLGARVTCQDLLVFAADGPIDNKLRFPDECVRHKTLDLLGDLALAGCHLSGRITASRSGHRLNAELIRALLRKQPNKQNMLRAA
jgi:UDP-3-O-acyl N-acetylglucosamine deacetylase